VSASALSSPSASTGSRSNAKWAIPEDVIQGPKDRDAALGWPGGDDPERNEPGTDQMFCAGLAV
jgi:hypothetical protein